MTKSEFDSYRQRIWDQGRILIDQWNTSSTLAQKQGIRDQMATLVQGFKATYNSVRCIPGTPVFACIGKIEASWIDPRFNDFYQPLNNYLSQWTSELAASSAVPGSTSLQGVDTSSCVAGICGPVPSSTPLQFVATGAQGSQGQVSVVTSGGGGVVGQPLPILQAGLSPSPFTNDLPGSLTPTALTPTGAVAAPVDVAMPANGFSIRSFVAGPMGKALLALLALAFLLHFAVKGKGG